jgi:hypothetical protein
MNQTTEQQKQKQKNFINLTPGLKAKILDNLRNALDVISDTPGIQAQAFAVHEHLGAYTETNKLIEQTAGLCVMAVGPLAILLMAQINAMPELFNQLQVMHMRQLNAEASASSSDVEASESGDSIITPGSSLIV